jgi:hypothetical protein
VNPSPKWVYCVVAVAGGSVGVIFAAGVVIPGAELWERVAATPIAAIWLAIAAQATDRLARPREAQRRAADFGMEARGRADHTSTGLLLLGIAVFVGGMLLKVLGPMEGEYSWSGMGGDLAYLISPMLLLGSRMVLDLTRNGESR